MSEQPDEWGWCRDLFDAASKAAKKVIDACKVHPRHCPSVEEETQAREAISALGPMFEILKGESDGPLMTRADPMVALEAAFEVNQDIQVLSDAESLAILMVLHLVPVAMMAGAPQEAQGGADKHALIVPASR